MNLFKNEGIYQGKWRVANTDGPIIPGTLKITRDGGAQLHLSGGFHGANDFFKHITFPAIWGELFDRKKVSLFHCHLEDQNVSQEVFNSSFSISSLGIGEEFVLPGISQFSAIRLQISSLHNWLGKNLVSSSIDDMSMEYVPLPDMRFDLPTLGRFEFASRARTRGSWRSGRINANAYLEIRWNNELKDVNVCLKDSWTIQRLFQLLMGGKCHIEKFDFYLTEKDKWIGIYTEPHFEGRPSDLNGGHMVAPHFRLGDQFPSILEDWLILNRKFDDELWLYSRSILLDGPFTHFEFLALTQVLESFHRHFGTNALYMEQDKYVKDVYAVLMNAIPATVNSSHRDSLKGRIKFGNEVSFAKRLNELMKSLTPKQRDWICTDQNRFVNRIKATRNFYTHLSTDDESEVLRGVDLFHAFEKLQILFEIQILRKIGISDALIEKSFPHNARRLGIIQRGPLI